MRTALYLVDGTRTHSKDGLGCRKTKLFAKAVRRITQSLGELPNLHRVGMAGKTIGGEYLINSWNLSTSIPAPKARENAKTSLPSCMKLEVADKSNSKYMSSSQCFASRKLTDPMNILRPEYESWENPIEYKAVYLAVFRSLANGLTFGGLVVNGQCSTSHHLNGLIPSYSAIYRCDQVTSIVQWFLILSRGPRAP